MKTEMKTEMKNVKKAVLKKLEQFYKKTFMIFLYAKKYEYSKH